MTERLAVFQRHTRARTSPSPSPSHERGAPLTPLAVPCARACAAQPSDYCVWLLPRRHMCDLFLAPEGDVSRGTLLAALADALRVVCRKIYWAPFERVLTGVPPPARCCCRERVPGGVR